MGTPLFMMKKRIFIICLLVLPSLLRAETYIQPQEFLSEAFSGDVPRVSTLWIKKDLKKKVREILKHDLGVLRVRYWSKNGRTAWILEEIGKEKPITIGLVVNEERLEKVEVLAFRETRGWEIRYPFFTNQFKGAGLTDESLLDKQIDGISGATLSVRAMTRMSRLAILLHRHSQHSE